MLDAATPDYFRRQFFDFRPLDRINTDIDLCFQSLRRVHDVPKLASLILAGSEMRERASELNNEWVIGALLDLGKREIAAERLRDGRVLLSSNGFALGIAGRARSSVWISRSSERSDPSKSTTNERRSNVR
jgi:hypothetical protein